LARSAAKNTKLKEEKTCLLKENSGDFLQKSTSFSLKERIFLLALFKGNSFTVHFPGPNTRENQQRKRTTLKRGKGIVFLFY